MRQSYMKRHAGTIAAALCGLVLFVFSIFWQDLSGASGAREWVRVLSNAALVPGVLLTGVGLLVRIADENFFDGIRYATGSLISHLQGKPKRHASYYDYLHRTKKKSPALSILLPGLIYLGAAAALTALYYFL